MIFYSPSNNGFYDNEINSVLPDDCIEISSQDHARYLHEMSANNKEIACVDGVITLRDRTEIAIISLKYIKARRNRLLKNCDYTQTLDFSGDKEAWAVYRQALRDIPQTYPNPADVVWPTIPGQ